MVYGRLGHIEGSINVAAVNGVNGHKKFKSADELRVQFADALAKSRVITYRGGIAASSTTMLLTMLGHNHVQLYDASLAEWVPDPTLPMER